MPSSRVLPTIEDLLGAAAGALRGAKDNFADTRRGSLYDHAAGPMAILFSREADRDRDLFDDSYLQSARGDALTTLIEGRYGTARVLSTAGTGICRFVRSSATAGAGTMWQGSRIQVPGSPPGIYQIASDTPAGATQLIADIPIEASVMGPGSAISVNTGLSLLDPLYDPLWQPQVLTCADGTDYEHADAYRARTLQARLDARNGYLPRQVQTCQAQGATYVVAFSSQYGLTNDDTGFANDAGLNAIYVADGNFQSSPSLIQSCHIALESTRVLGADLWVGGITQSTLYANAEVSLVDDPGKLDQVPIEMACAKALLTYFSGTASGYTFKRDAMTGAMRRAHPAVQRVRTWNSPTQDVALASNSWPALLTRYVLYPRNITLSFVGPS
jgi:Baseplate J-like protein